MIRLLKKHGTARHMLDKASHEDRTEQKLAAVALRLLHQQARKSVREAEGPVFFCYSGDGTPLLCRTSVNFRVSDHTRARRSGKTGQTEFFCQSSLLLTMGVSGAIMRYLTAPLCTCQRARQRCTSSQP